MRHRNLLSKLPRLLACVALLATCASGWAQPARVADLRSAHDPALQRSLEGAVRDLGLERHLEQHQLALALVDVTDAQAPRLAMLNGDEMMYAASLPKIGILFGAMAEVESGRFPLDEERLQAMNRMIRHSSNVDASRVLEWVGGERLLGWLQSDRFRFYDAQGAGGLWVGKAYGPEPAFQRDPLRNLSHGATAFQVARLYTLLAAGTLFQPRVNELMLDILSKPGIHHKFVRALQDLPGVRIYRKSGTWKNFHADSALVEQGGRRFVMVAIAEHPDGGDWLVRLGARMNLLIAPPVRREAGLAQQVPRPVSTRTPVLAVGTVEPGRQRLVLGSGVLAQDVREQRADEDQLAILHR
jgi:beta-lactamase class A